MNDYSEDKLVQETTINYFHDKLGWDTAFAYNDEVLGENGTFGRRSYKEIILPKQLKRALQKLNPNLDDKIYQIAIDKITNISTTKTLNQINKEQYDLFKNGVKVEIKNNKGQLEEKHLKIFNYEDYLNNHFLAVREFQIQGSIYKRRADIIGFVNGIPLLFIELKAVHKDVRTAYEQNLSDYFDTVPAIFYNNAMIILSNGDEGRVGSVTSIYEYYNEWKRLSEDDKGVVEFETMLKGVCTKENFMDIFENFIVFDESSGKTVKIVARNHQFLGVNEAFESVKTRKERKRKLGVFWHTQGSGKSYSMVFFCQKIHRKLKGNYTFVIMTDRVELDTQIYNTFEGIGAVKNDKSICAVSGNDLERLLREDHRYIFSLIHKFNKDVSEPYSNRDDIIVVSDEAHRTQYGKLAWNMRNALPNASFIGFTGTPLFKEDELTKEVFGEYVSTYDFATAVEDGATVPLYYENRGEKLKIVHEDINQKIVDRLEDFDLDTDQIAKLQREMGREYHILTSNDRLEKIAKDFVEHYTSIWTTGKAMFVCIDKITAVKMYDLIQKYWKVYTEKFEKEIEKSVDEQDLLKKNQKLKWLNDTEMAVVISEEQNEMKKFKKWDLDILPHREKIKKRDLEKEFKNDDSNFRIAIVCAMWLTGFDVKSLSTLYLDKPLKAHTLMQAIARANRVYEDKNNGLIVDYNGVLKSLNKALAQYAVGKTNGNDGDDPIKPEEELFNEFIEVINTIKSFFKDLKFDIDDLIESIGFIKIARLKEAVEVVYTSDEIKKKFEILSRELFKKFRSLNFNPKANDYLKYYDAVNAIYKKLQDNKQSADISDIIKSLHELVEESIESVDMVAEPTADYNKKYDISKIDFERLKNEFSKIKRKNTAFQSLREMVEKKLQKMVKQNPLRIDYYKRYQEIIEEYNTDKDRITIEETFKKLIDFIECLSDEDKRAVREGLTEEYLAIFDLLIKDKQLKNTEQEKVKKISIDLLEKLKTEKLKIDHWRDKIQTVADVKTTILDFLWETLPEDTYRDEEIEQRKDMVFNFLWENYDINQYENNYTMFYNR